jgi:Flp pilus assembly secretin CpaC
VPYETGSAVSNGTTQNSFDFLDVGLVLTVTPRITSSGYVTMDVSQTANSIAAFLDNNTEPEVNQREAETTVSVMDGRTVCLGGIIQDTINSTVDKVPLLGDIPLIGDLFKNTTKSDDKDELLVFLTPHVINNPENAETVRASNAANLDGDAAAMLKKANITPKTGEASSTTNVLPTIVTVTPNIQTTPPVIVGPTGGSVYAAPPGPTVNPPVAPGMTTPVTPATTKTQVAPSAVTTTTTQVTSPTPTPPATSAAPVVTTSPLGIDSTGNVTTN